MFRTRDAGASASAALTVVIAGVLILWGALSIEPALKGLVSAGVIVHFGLNTVIVLIALGAAATAHPYSLHIFHLIGLLIFACVAGLYQYLEGTFPMAGPTMAFQREIPIACFAVSLWITAYLAGYSLRCGPFGSLKPVAWIVAFEKPIGPASIHFSLILGLFALAYLASIGLLGAFTRAEAEASLALAASGPKYLINGIFVRAIPLLAVAATALAIRRGRKTMEVGLLALIFGAEVVGVAIANNPFAAARYWFVAVAVGLAAPHLFAARKTGVPMLICATLGLSVLPSLGAARDSTSFGEIAKFYLRLDSPFEYFAKSGDVDAFGMICLAIKWIGFNGHTWGMQILGAALFWVPRSIWPSKPVGTGSMVSGGLGFEFTNLSVPIMTDPMVDFGLIGVPFFGFAFGWVLASIDRRYWTSFGVNPSANTLRRIDVIYPFWVGLMLFLTRGDLLSSFGYTVGMTLAMFPFFLVPERVRSRYAPMAAP